MKKTTLTWTALPNGSDGPLAAGTTLRLSVLMSPRLWNDDPGVSTMPLSEFPDFLDWPAQVAGSTFDVTFDGGPTISAAPQPGVLRSDLWQALFKDDTLIIPHQFEDLTGASVLTFDAGAIHDTIRDVYQRAATDAGYGAGLNLPHVDVLAADDDLQEIARPVRPQPPYVPGPTDRGPVVLDSPEEGERPGDGDGRPGCRDLLERAGCLSPIGCLGLFGLLLMLLALLLRLLRRLLSATVEFTPRVRFGVGGGPASPAAAFDDLNAYIAPTSLTSVALPTQADLAAMTDFHKMIASLGDYPNLLRYLGLVVDLELVLPEELPASPGLVSVQPSITLQATTTHYTPRTHYVLADGRFAARPRPSDSDIANGLLRLDDASRFRVMQVDVAGGGVKLQNTATNVVGTTALNTRPRNEPKEQGLPALQTAGVSIVRPEKAAQLEATFVRSYALNASLAAVDGSPLPPVASGGPPPPPDDALFADDLVRGYRIDVWDDVSEQWHSLCQRLGDYVFLEPEGGAPGDTLALSAEADEGFVQMSVTEPLQEGATRVLRAHESLFTWDGWSLCAPRPGQTILPDHTTGDATNEAVTPFRMEATFQAMPGTLPRLRFGYAYRLRARVADLAGNSVFVPGEPAFEQDQPEITPLAPFWRFEPVAPPPLLLSAEPIEGESLERIVVRSAVTDAAGTITSQQSERHIAPAKVSQLMSERHRKFDGAPGMNKDQAAYDLAAREAGTLTHAPDPLTGDLLPLPGVQEVSDPATQRTYWLQTGAQHEVAYLPDPYARGVLLLGLPGMTSFEEIIEPNGQVVNKIPFAGAWPNLLPLRLRLVGLPAGDAPAQPAWNVAERLLTVQLAQGESANVRVCSYFHAADLPKMAIWGWTEEAAPADLAALKAQAESGRNWLQLPYRELALVHAVQQPLAIPQFNTLNIAPARDVGETAISLAGQLAIDGKSTGKVDVWAAWTDPFDDPAKPAYNAASDVTSQEMHVAELRMAEDSDDEFDFTATRHTIGDLKYHRVTYTPLATTRFREYFPAAITADPLNLRRPLATEAPLPIELDVPNAQRPDAPNLLYTLPIFRWTQTDAANVITRERRGGGLRVYMERPWFSSGAGELLAALVRLPGISPTGERAQTLSKYTSEWGMDPLWNAANTAPLRVVDFVEAVEMPLNLSLDELAGETVHAAAYEPVYDTDRDLWVADVKLASEQAYFPFVRLALARYQPISVPDAHLSRVTLAEFTQVVPHRVAEYDLNNLVAGNTVHVRLRGPAYFHVQQEQLASPFVLLRLERRQHGDDGDDVLGWEAIATQLLPPVQQTVEETIWEGVMTVPPGLPQPLRLSLLEVELYLVDRDRWQDVLALFEQEMPDDDAGTSIIQLRQRGYRVVFADSLMLP